MSIKIRYGLIGLILLAFSLRLHNFFFDSFQADEALFANWARLIAVFRDPLLQSQIVDKPPLLFYFQALFYPMLGPVVQAARFPSLIASILFVPLSYLLVIRLYRQEIAAIMVALLITLSPILIRYSATAYIDPLMTTLITISLFIVAGYLPEKAKILSGTGDPIQPKKKHVSSLFNRGDLTPYAVGLLFGLAVAAKYQAIFYLPLIAGLALINGWRWRQFLQGFISFTVVIISLIIWDVAQDGKLNLIDTQWRSIGGIRLIWSHELMNRLEQWSRYWTSILPTPVFLIILLMGTPIFLYGFFRERNRKAVIDMLLLLFAVGYFLLHWLAAIPIWSRYIFLIAPIVIILFVRLALKLGVYSSRLIQKSRLKGIAELQLSWLWLIIFLLMGLIPARDARMGVVQLSDIEQLDGSVKEVAAYLTNAPSGTVLYDHWYSWHWRYYLFDSDIYVSWFPDIQALSDDLAVFGRDGTQRYLALPNDEIAKPVIRAVIDAGFQLEEAYSQELNVNADISLYRIVVGIDD